MRFHPTSSPPPLQAGRHRVGEQGDLLVRTISVVRCSYGQTWRVAFRSRGRSDVENVWVLAGPIPNRTHPPPQRAQPFHERACENDPSGDCGRYEKYRSRTWPRVDRTTAHLQWRSISLGRAPRHAPGYRTGESGSGEAALYSGHKERQTQRHSHPYRTASIVRHCGRRTRDLEITVQQPMPIASFRHHYVPPTISSRRGHRTSQFSPVDPCPIV